MAMHQVDDFSDFVAELADMRVQATANEITKQRQMMISPAIYTTPIRSNDNVVGWGRWLAYDIDNTGPIPVAVDEILAWASPFNHVVYNSMQSTASCPRLRLILETSRELLVDEIKPVWNAVRKQLDGLGVDDQCKDISRIYVAPMLWLPCDDGVKKSNPDPENIFEFQIDSGVIEIDNLTIDTPPMNQLVNVPIQPTRPSKPTRLKQMRSIVLFDNPCVTSEMIDWYLGLAAGQHHGGLYTFMTKIAGRAKALGYDITADDLVSFARQMDQLSSVKTASSRWARIKTEAERALKFSNSH